MNSILLHAVVLCTFFLRADLLNLRFVQHGPVETEDMFTLVV